MSESVHNHCLKISRKISPKLTRAFEHVGPVEPQPRWRMSIPVLLCRAVIGQQLSVSAASKIWGRLRDSAKPTGVIKYIQKAEIEDLRRCGLSAGKCRAVQAIVEAAENGLIQRQKLKRMDVAERDKVLTSIWGVGQWTSDVINMFYFREPDIWPAGDVAVVKTLQRLTSARRSTSRTAEMFAPYKTYLALYMYGWVNNPPLKENSGNYNGRIK